MLISLKPGSKADSLSDLMSAKGLSSSLETRRSQSRPGLLQLSYIQNQLDSKENKEPSPANQQRSWQEEKHSSSSVSNGQDLMQNSPPKTENEVGFIVE